ITDAVADAPSVEGVSDDVSPALASDDGQAVQAFIPIDGDAELADAVAALGDELRDAAPDGVTVYITGPAGFSADLVAGFAGIDGLLLGVALLAVLIILVL
ncbi:MMPL family transporter, partial [Pseudomonas sp. BGM005]|nr:MMPL family transporter [Pseudomonas sp. BG5]